MKKSLGGTRLGTRGVAKATAKPVAAKAAFRADRYTYRTMWSDEDQGFVGLCAEFPSLSHVDGTQVDALVGITKLVADVVADMVQTGESRPEPLASRKYSGQFKVRIPAPLHRRLAIEAAEEGVSMNRIISMKLAQA